MGAFNGIISFGGTSTSSTGSSSGIQSVNGAIGPAITIVGGSGIQVDTVGNVITISASGTSTGTVNRFSAAFTNVTDAVFTHGLGTQFVLVQTYDDQVPPHVFIPDEIIVVDANNVRLKNNRPQNGQVLIIG